MEFISVYIIKSTVCLIAFYVGYYLLLRKETFHRLNRVCLIGILLLSSLLPFVELKINVAESVIPSAIYWEELLSYQISFPEKTTFLETLPLLLFLYIAGMLFFTVRFLYSLRKIRKIIGAGEKRIIEGGYQLVLTHQPIQPFSWMKSIVISRTDWVENGKEIWTHELGHIRSYHSWDVLVMQLFAVLHWFNPVVWLLKQELQNIHEYEADRNVLQEGIEPKRYQLLLIKKTSGPKRFALAANSFNHSKIKKRIHMMIKGKSSQWAYLKYLYMFPLAFILVTVYAKPEIDSRIQALGYVKVASVFPEGGPLWGMVKWGIPNDTVHQDSIKIQNAEPLYFVNQVELQPNEFRKIDPADIESINVLKGSEAIEKYGNGGKNGVLEITTKGVKEKSSQKEITHSSSENVIPAGFSSIPKNSIIDSDKYLKLLEPSTVKRIPGAKRSDTNYQEALVVIDGMESTQEDLQNLDPTTIQSISVLKEDAHIKIYGEKAKQGVIIVQTKQ